MKIPGAKLIGVKLPGVKLKLPGVATSMIAAALLSTAPLPQMAVPPSVAMEPSAVVGHSGTTFELADNWLTSNPDEAERRRRGLRTPEEIAEKRALREAQKAQEALKCKEKKQEGGRLRDR